MNIPFAYITGSLRWLRRCCFAWWPKAINLILCLALLISSSPLRLGPDPVAAADARRSDRQTSDHGRLTRDAPPTHDESTALQSQPSSPAAACTLVGDVDNDGAVTSLDLQAIAAHWRTRSGEANYDSRFDLNGDGRVDIVDIMRASTHFGESCPVYGTIVGLVTNAADDAPVAGATIAISSTVYVTTTNASGAFNLAVPPGTYTLDIAQSGFTTDHRTANVLLNQVSRVEDVRLHLLDANTAAIGSGGGTITNSLANTSLVFPPGALPATQQARLTFLPNAELPGYFPDGSIPLGFADMKPEGLVFPPGKEVLWTVAYTGTLPVGTNTLCYWWDGAQARWRDPVPGKVVDLGNGQKALQASVPHFSAYGFANPPDADPRPAQSGDPTTANLNAGQGCNQTQKPGCLTNVGTGSLSESYTFQPVSSRGFPVALVAHYSTSNDTPAVTARAPFTLTTGSAIPSRAAWRLEFQGKVYTGDGYTPQASWDTRNALGYRAAPGVYPFTARETFYFNSGAQPSLQISSTVELRRGDIWPFGFNWMTGYDSLLVDNTDTATLIQGDGQYLTYRRQPDGSYASLFEDYSTLVRNPDRTWTRTSKYGDKESFNAQGRLVRVEDRNGNAQTLLYDPNGASLPDGVWGLATRLKSIADASGRVTTLTYGADGYVSKVTDAIGRQYTLAHDAAGNLTSITDPLGRATTYEYDASHLLTRYTYPRGNSTGLAYDSQRRLVRHTDALNQDRTTTYGDNSNTLTDERGVATTYQFNPYGAITQVRNPVQTSSSTFDDRRQLVGTEMPRQRFTYDARGNLTDYTNPLRSSAAYEPTYNQPISRTDTAGNITRFAYDARGNLTAIADPLGATYQSEYDSAGQLVRFTDPLSQTTRFEYDAFGNLTRLADPLGFQSALAHDAAGNLTQITDAESHSTAYAYDAMNRLTTATDALGRVTRYEYDGNNNLTRLADARNNSTIYTYDALDRLTRETDPLGNSTNYAYDAVGNVASITRANGIALQYTYDAANRLTAEQYPGGGTTYRYNTINDLIGVVDANVLMTYTYPSALPGRPDTVETRLVANPNIRSTISYDYAATAAGGAPRSKAETPSGASTGGPALALPELSPEKPRPSDVTPALQAYRALPTSVSTEVCGSINADTTWTAANSPYVATCDISVSSGATLTVEPGVVVKFTKPVFPIGLVVVGTLIANGTAAQPITFTSIKDDSAGGDTNGDGSASQPVPGDWNGLYFDPTSTGSELNHAMVRYGGNYGGNVEVRTTSITLTHNTFALSASSGLNFNYAHPPALVNNTFISNTNAAVRALVDNDGQSIVLSGNSARGNGVNGFEVSATISGTVTWVGDEALPFVVDGLTVKAGARLTLTPGTVVKSATGYLGIDGTLIADGTEAQPIYFTSIKDDTVGGDTNGDGSASNPAPGDWFGCLFFGKTSAGSVLNHAVVRYGGSYAYCPTNVWVATDSLTLTNSTIAFSRGEGVVVSGASPNISGNIIRDNVLGIVTVGGARPALRGNKIFGNSQYGLSNNNLTVTVDAQNNWWGSVKGPYDPSDDRATGGWYNPSGDGDRVSDGVNYAPWQILTGLVYGVTIATGNNPAQTVRYGYDALNRLSSLTASGPASFMERYTYDAAGRLTVAGPAAGNPGVSTALEYDADSRLTRLANRSPNSATTFNDFRYTYDRVGNVLTVDDGSGTTTYTYDALYQLTGVSGPGLSETYTYDEVGNRLSKNPSTPQSTLSGQAVTYNYNAANQLTSSSDGTTYTYDNNGNLRTKSVGGQTTTYSWDIKDRLVRIDFPDGTFAAYTYDAMGRRVSKRDRAGTLTYYVYNGLNLAQELDAAGTAVASYVHDGLDRPLSMTRGGATYYYIYDQLGSVVGLTDGAGVLVVSYRFDPWGNVIATGGSNPNLANPFRFTGREFDAESGLYFYRLRYYDPQVGRFISRDPLRTITREPNAYAYVSNNPVSASDPQGLDTENRRWWQTIVGIGTGLVVGAGVVLLAPVSVPTLAVLAGATVAGGLAGGGVTLVSERFARPCERDYWAAFKAGWKGGLVGGAIGGFAALGVFGQGALAFVWTDLERELAAIGAKEALNAARAAGAAAWPGLRGVAGVVGAEIARNAFVYGVVGGLAVSMLTFAELWSITHRGR